MKRNAKINSRKLSTLICLVLTLVIAMTAMFVVTASAAEESYDLVTSTSELNVGDKVIIVAKDYDMALSTDQKSSNRGAATITKSGNTVTFGSSVQVLTLEAGTKASTFAFNTGSGYLYAASSGSNHLKTETNKSDNSSWAITISADGTATIVAQGANTRNTMQYNTSNSGLFAAYASASQKAVVIYKLPSASTPDTPSCEHTNTTTTTTPADCTNAGSSVTTCNDCDYSSTTTIPALGHNYENDTCTRCGAEKPAGYELVSDVSTLKVGDKIIIVAAAADRALGSQSGNYRKEATITKANNVVTFEDTAGVEIITIEAGKNAGTFAFKVTEGYLSAVSSSSNNLGTETTISENSSWAINISDGIAEIVAQGDYTRNTLNYNLSSPRFSCYANTSAMKDKDVSIYKLPVAEPEQPDVPDCQHTNKTTTTNPAKCESDGSTVVTCADCGEELSRDIIPATGHVNTTETTVDSTCTTNGTTTVTCNDCGKTISTETLDKAAHDYDAEGICGVCGFDKNDKGFSGNYAIFAIRSSGNYYAMSSDLGDATTKRYQALDVGAAELPECIYSDDVSSDEHNLIFALEKNEDGTYYLYAVYMESNNYLGWSSGNSGTLVAKENAKKLTVDKNDDGTYNIYFNDGSANRYLSLNGTTNNDYFAWYTGTQRHDLTLLPIVEGQAPTDPENPDQPGGGNPDNPEPDNPETPECTHTATFNSANVNLGDSLSLKCFLNICEHDDISNYKMAFTMNDNTVIVSYTDEAPAGYMFVFSGIAPQCMGDSIKIEVLKNDAVLENMTVINYSIKTNLVALLEDYPGDEKLHQLVYDTLAYGAAAQKYCGYKTNALVNAGYEALASTYEQPADTHTLSARADGATASFKSAAVEFGDYNTILIKINATDVTNFKLMFGEVELALGYAGDDVYYAFTDAISALNLKNSYTFTLYENGTVVQTLTYSVNDYASRKWNDAEMGELVKALYAYGVSATAYAN